MKYEDGKHHLAITEGNEGGAPGVGHNAPSVDAVVEENLRRGLYLTHLLALQRCIKDPRLEQRHRLVLVALSECTNSKSALAYPGRAWLAANIVYYVNGEARHYSEGTIANTLSELAELGYLRMRRQAPETGGRRALAHYAITSPSLEDLQALIAEACAAIRAAPRRPFPAADVKTGVDVNSNLDVKTSVGADVKTSGGQELGKLTGSRGPQDPTAKTTPLKTTSRQDGKAVSHLNGKHHPLRERVASDNSRSASGTLEPLATSPPAMTEAEMTARSNPDGEVAYAWRNIHKTAAGKIEIGDEFRRDLRETYSDSEINMGLERAPGSLARAGSSADLTTSRGLIKVRDVIRSGCSYAKPNRAAKQAPAGNKGVF